MKFWSQGARLWRTIRPLGVGQVVTRCRHVAQRYWWRATGRTAELSCHVSFRPVAGLWRGLDDELPATLRDAVAVEVAIATEAQRNAFSFLGRSLTFDREVDWQTTEASQLWRYHLHYFGCVRSLLVTSRFGARDEAAYVCFRRLASSWIAGNRALRGDGWHPYTLSLRLVLWIQAAQHWRERLARDDYFRTALTGSLYAQARILRRQMEFDVRGNHLLENLRALWWAGCAFDGDEAREWRATADRVLRRETADQILADGGHFERTPGYHAVVLRDYLELALLSERNDGKCPDWLRSSVHRQSLFLRDVLGPGQRLPLVKDTTFDGAPRPNDLLHTAAAWLGAAQIRPDTPPGFETFLVLGRAAWETARTARGAGAVASGHAALAASGFYVLRGAKEHALIDAGQPCPDYLPAHAHADSLSYEYHFEQRPVVVDSGVFEYQAGAWRDFFRSTRAHNTVEIDGQNSSEVWSSFRVGRRARVAVTAWETGGKRAALTARHDGYRFLPGRPSHERTIFWEEGRFFLILDRITGGGTATLASYIHFHPDLRPVEESPGCWRVDVDGCPLWCHQIGEARADMVQGQGGSEAQGWYSERFGEKRPNAVLRFSTRATLPHVFGYALSPERRLQVAVQQRNHGCVVRVTGSGDEFVGTIAGPGQGASP